MALHVAPELWDKYSVFYRLALDRETDDSTAWILDGATQQSVDAALAGPAGAEPPRTVIVKNCPELRGLSFLERMPEVEWVCVWRCARLDSLWDMSKTPRLRGLALTDCYALRELGAVAGAPGLEHLLFQQSAWRRGRLESLLPLENLRELRTLDLACKGVRDKSRLEFRRLFPHIEALTITPNMRENLIADAGAKG